MLVGRCEFYCSCLERCSFVSPVAYLFVVAAGVAAVAVAHRFVTLETKRDWTD